MGNDKWWKIWYTIFLSRVHNDTLFSVVTPCRNTTGAQNAGNFDWQFEFENVKLFYFIDSLQLPLVLIPWRYCARSVKLQNDLTEMDVIYAILRDLSSRWISGGFPILRQPYGYIPALDDNRPMYSISQKYADDLMRLFEVFIVVWY